MSGSRSAELGDLREAVAQAHERVGDQAQDGAGGAAGAVGREGCIDRVAPVLVGEPAPAMPVQVDEAGDQAGAVQVDALVSIRS